MRAEEETLTWQELKPLIDKLARACDTADSEEIRRVLLTAVAGFEPDASSDSKGKGVEIPPEPAAAQGEKPPTGASVTPLFSTRSSKKK